MACTVCFDLYEIMKLLKSTKRPAIAGTCELVTSETLLLTAYTLQHT